MSAFETAVADSKKLTAKPSDNELLELYGASLFYFLAIYSSTWQAYKNSTSSYELRAAEEVYSFS